VTVERERDHGSSWLLRSLLHSTLYILLAAGR
jgi:hypothetical protein